VKPFKSIPAAKASSISFEIGESIESKPVAIDLSKHHIELIDELRSILGFKSRGMVLRWIFEQLEHEQHLSRWTHEMLSRQRN
jgi:hypothetical protein